MPKACPLPTPTERVYGEIHDRIKSDMLRKVYAALQEATEQARTEMAAAGLDLPPPSAEYLGSVIHQSLYCTLCEADPDTFLGGRADVAVEIIRNAQNIARHYWDADIEPHPRT